MLAILTEQLAAGEAELIESEALSYFSAFYNFRFMENNLVVFGTVDDAAACNRTTTRLELSTGMFQTALMGRWIMRGQGNVCEETQPDKTHRT